MLGVVTAISGFGVVGVDGKSFHKLVDGSGPVLVRFAKVFLISCACSELHSLIDSVLPQRWEEPASVTFRDWAIQTARSDSALIVAEVEYHEDIEELTGNLELANGFGLTEETMPAILLFPEVALQNVFILLNEKSCRANVTNFMSTTVLIMIIWITSSSVCLTSDLS